MRLLLIFLFLIAVFGLSTLFFQAALIDASDGSSVAPSASQSIRAFGICKKVTNTSPTGKTVYVPTQSVVEWASFFESPPQGVTIGACLAKLTFLAEEQNATIP